MTAIIMNKCYLIENSYMIRKYHAFSACAQFAHLLRVNIAVPIFEYLSEELSSASPIFLQHLDLSYCDGFPEANKVKK